MVDMEKLPNRPPPRTRWTLKRVHAVLLPALALCWTFSSGTAHAFQSCLNTFSDRYPSSTSTTAGCRLCHVTSPGGAAWNAYGSFLQQNDTTSCSNPPLAAAESLDADGIAGINLVEINANAQPGWCNPATPGCINQSFNRLGTATGTATPPTGVLLDPTTVGLVAAYSFNEATGAAVADSSGNGNTGSIANATRTLAGKYGGALVFDGTTALVTIADSASLRLTTAMTLEAWVNPSTVSSAWRDVIYKGDSDYYLEGTSAPSGLPAMGGTFSSNPLYGTEALTTNTWSHLAATYDGATVRLYVNGSQVASRSQTGAIPTSASPLQIGGDSIYGQFFSGAIDEVRVYNVALTLAQIQADRDTPIGAVAGCISAPSEVLALALSGAGPTQLSWQPPSDPGGSTLILYDVLLSPTPGDFTSASCLATGITSTTYADSGSSSASYYLIRTRNGCGGNLGTVSGGTPRSGPVCAQSDGLVGAWSFDEGAGTTSADLSANGNLATLQGAVWTPSGKHGSALSFDGISAKAVVADSATLDLTEAMTLEAWVYPDVVPTTWATGVYKETDRYYLEPGTSQNAPGAGGTFGSGNRNAIGGSPLPAMAWTHLACTYNGADVRLYVNGAQAGSVSATGAITTSTSPLTMGGNTPYGEFFNGRIDDVRVYSRALSAAEIQTDMNTPVGAAPLPDSEAPTAPVNLVAEAMGPSRIDLVWGAAADNFGVTLYRVERCEGSGCTTFAPVGTTPWPVTTYSDSGLTLNTSYSYRVRANDAAGNLGPYSNTAQAVTVDTVTPRRAVVTFTQQQQFQTSVGGATWSVDSVVGGSPASGTITAGGLYTPPSAAGSHTVTASNGPFVANATVYVSNNPGVFTYHNDNFRTGQNLSETILTPANVETQFGKLFSYPLDGLALASPLYVANVAIPGQGFHNVVYVATEHNSVYAFDADRLSADPLWQVSFINPAAGVTSVPAGDTGETGDIPGEIGITGTPVIDSVSGTLYVVAKTKEVNGGNTNYVQRLHALDIGSGAEKFGGPVTLQASVPGTGVGSQGGQVPFDALRENQRPALLLSNGVVYIAFGSHGDVQPYHGWVLGYNAATLQQVFAFNATPNNEGAGIWQSGGGLAADASGSAYFVTGDGTFTASTGGIDYGDSVMKLGPTGAVLDYFTPYDQAVIDASGEDLCAAGLILLPDQPGAHPHLLIASGKNATVYLIDRDQMGHFNPTNNSHAVQTLPNIFPNGSEPIPGNFITSVYFDGAVYFSPTQDTIQAFRLSNGLLPTSPTSRSLQSFAFPGLPLAISANGSTNGILWALERKGGYSDWTTQGTLHAYDPADLSIEFYNSDQAGTRDALEAQAAKYSVPLVVNGKVFVVSVNSLLAYGLLP